MSKPVIHYTWCSQVRVGESANVWVVDHPKLAPGLVHTSIVRSIDGPQFETLNSIYRPFEVPPEADLTALQIGKVSA